MPPKPRCLSMAKDDLVWQKLEEVSDEWETSARTKDAYRAIGNLIRKYKSGQAEKMHPVIRGGYNIVYRLQYKDGSSAVARIPIKGVVPFPDEKIRYEVATMRYVARNTTIPVPHVYHYGTAAENPAGLGPFIIMDYIDHHQNMSRALLDPNRAPSMRPVLDPDIDNKKLELLYSQMANIILQLSALRFPRVGSLLEDEAGSISVAGRPLISNMNDIVVHTNAPLSVLPTQTYSSANEWYAALAAMHTSQFFYQIHDAVEDEDDARDKYMARHLFQSLALKNRLHQNRDTSEVDFRLYSEDFRPANVLLDENYQVVGVIDWEFAYAAPAQFSFDPPWWLILEEPESWAEGYQAWAELYEPQLKTFLSTLRAEEDSLAADHLASKSPLNSVGNERETEPRLSARMWESWEKRFWMLNYAARKSWAFDFIWWKFLDMRYFGPNENQDYSARLEMLSESQLRDMETVVTKKIAEGRG